MDCWAITTLDGDIIEIFESYEDAYAELAYWNDDHTIIPVTDNQYEEYLDSY